jgi:flagellar protein FliS
MMSAASLARYREMEILGESPRQLAVRLYAHLGVTLRQALLHFEAGRRGEMVDRLGRAHAVLQELSASLDFERGGDVARALDDLYRTYLDLVTEQMRAPEAPRLTALVTMADDLHTAWRTACAEAAA